MFRITTLVLVVKVDAGRRVSGAWVRVVVVVVVVVAHVLVLHRVEVLLRLEILLTVTGNEISIGGRGTPDDGRAQWSEG